MAYITKEQFEVIIKEKYDNLTKQEFGELMQATKSKVMELMKAGEVAFEKGDDDYELTYASQPFYEIAFNTLQFVSKTRKLSFKQYKCLSAFINAKVASKEETQYKQF